MQRPLHDIRHLLDNLAREGKALIVSCPTDATTGAASNFTVPVGQVALITKLWAQGHGTADASPSTETIIRNSLSFVDAGGGAEGGFRFQSGQRLTRTYAVANTPSWQTAVPNVPVQWEPSHPIVVPSGWSVDSDQTSQTCGGFGLYGYLVDNGLAARYGIDVNNDADPAKRLLKQGSASISSTPEALVDGKTDYCIQILDMYIRMQPTVHSVSTSKTIRLFQNAQGVGFSPADLDRTIFRFTNNNPEMMEVKLSPGIYLKPGAGFHCEGSDTSDNLCATISYICRYVHKSKVPQNHFWGHCSPELPTPSLASYGSLNNIRVASTGVTLFYPNPGEDANGNAITDTIANSDKQHVVEGIAWSIQKDLDTTSDHVVFSVTAGSAAGTLGVDVYSVTQTNKLLIPMLNAAGNDQNVSGCIDRVRIPCPKETGIFVESFALGGDLIATPTDTAANIDEWDVTVWGETIPAVYGTAHFKGSVS